MVVFSQTQTELSGEHEHLRELILCEPWMELKSDTCCDPSVWIKVVGWLIGITTHSRTATRAAINYVYVLCIYILDMVPHYMKATWRLRQQPQATAVLLVLFIHVDFQHFTSISGNFVQLPRQNNYLRALIHGSF